jgi:hypothetical protein
MYGSYVVHNAAGDRIGVNNFALVNAALPLGGGLPGPVYGTTYVETSTPLRAIRLTKHADEQFYWDVLWSHYNGYSRYPAQVRQDGTIISSNQNGYLYAFDPNGNPNPLWQKQGVDEAAPGIAADDTIRVITPGESGYWYNLICLDKNGNQVWTLPILRVRNTSKYYGLALDAEDTTYLTEGWYETGTQCHSTIVAVDSTGEIVWKLVNTPGSTPTNGSVVLGENRRLYVVNGYLIRAFGVPCPPDFNNDGDVDFSDYATFSEHWLNVGCNDPDWCGSADLDKDGKVDSADLKKLTGRWLKWAECD